MDIVLCCLLMFTSFFICQADTESAMEQEVPEGGEHSFTQHIPSLVVFFWLVPSYVTGY